MAVKSRWKQVPAYWFATEPPPPESATTDDFSAATLGAQWVFSSGAGGTAAQTGGELVLSGNTTSAFNGDCNVDQVVAGTLDSVYVKLSGPGTRAANAGGVESGFLLRNSATPDDRYVGFFQTSDGFLSMVGASGAGVFANTQIAFSATTHAWLRVIYSGGVVSLDTAPSTASNPPVAGDWTSRQTFLFADVPWVSEPVKTRMQMRIVAGLTSASEGTVKFDGYNTAANTGAVSGAIASASVALTTSALAGTQGQAGTIAAAAVAVTSSTPAGTSSESGIISPGSVAVTTTGPAGTQGQVGAVAGASVATSASTPTGTQGQQGAVLSAAVGVAAGALAGTQAQVGSIQGATVPVTASTPAGSSGTVTDGFISPASVATSSSSVAGTQGQAGAVSGAVVGLSADGVAGSQTQEGAIAPASVGAASGIVGDEPAPTRNAGFEMTSGGGARTVSFKPLLQRLIEERAKPLPAPKRHAAQVKAVEVKAAEAVLSGAGENKLQALMQQWIAAKPALPERKTDVLPLFLAQVAYRLRQMEQDEEDALLLLL